MQHVKTPRHAAGRVRANHLGETVIPNSPFSNQARFFNHLNADRPRARIKPPGISVSALHRRAVQVEVHDHLDLDVRGIVRRSSAR